MLRRVLAVALAALISLPALAQFYTQGNEPAGVRWMQLRTQDYNVVYPQGLDSLARIYAATLERVKYSVGATAGYIPNQSYKYPLPVILHPWTANANGMVTWTPSRMDLFTTPSYKAPQSAPWEQHLIIHESRHVAQLQFMNDRPYKPYGWLTGQLFAGAASSIYAGPAFFEGDAVAAETELTASGRGRQASFLEYYRAAFKQGDIRDFWRWRYGSIKYYTPDHYTIGYLRAAGIRSVYGANDFTARYYQRIFRKKAWPWPLFNYQGTLKEVSGKKVKEVYAEITDTLRQRWQRDEAARAPFIGTEQITPKPRRFTGYTGLTFLGDSLYAIRSGITKAPGLVRIDNQGKVRKLSEFAYSTSSLKASQPLGRIYWSEIRRDLRWEMVSYSEIWYAGPDGRHHRLSNGTRWYNPSVSPDGYRLAVTEYPATGGSSLLIIDALSGEVLSRTDAPDGLQIVESAWIGEEILVSGVNSSGSGIYNASNDFTPVLECGTAVLQDLFEYDGNLYFTADLTAVDQLYRLAGSQAHRVTSTPLGGTYYRFHGDSLYFSSMFADGRHVLSTPSAGLMQQEAQFDQPHRYEFAPDLYAPRPVPADSVITLPEPEPYKRLANAFRLHSWAPVYLNYDAVSDLSFESLFSTAGLGATGFFQNDLGNFYGSVAYGALYNSSGWEHRGEAKVTYTGLWPKIEASVSVSSDPASLYFMRRHYKNFERIGDISGDDIAGVPSVDASLLLYVPLNFSSGGWSRGVIPQVRASVSNSLFTHGRLVPMNRISASVRGYVISSTTTSCVYPRWGLGLEAGWSGRAGISEVFTPNAYFYAYGYLPGIMETHGLRLSTTFQTPVGNGIFAERYVSIMPRGMGSAGELASQMAVSPFQCRVTSDYAFPFLPLDWSGLGPIAYVRNFECTLHADASRFAGGRFGDALLASAGATVNIVLGNLLWLPFDTRVGVAVYRNFGTPGPFDPWHVGFDFSMDI